MTARKLGHSDLQFTISDLIKEGEVRYAGVSNASVEQLKRCSPPYSMLDRCFLFDQGTEKRIGQGPLCHQRPLGKAESQILVTTNPPLSSNLRLRGYSGDCAPSG